MAGPFSASTIDQVRIASDIVDVIGSFIPLKKTGTSWKALCPFHQEKTPSFTINPHRQMYYCFGCQNGGDVFKFLQDYESLNFTEAIKRLAERAGIVLQIEESGASDERPRQKELLLSIHQEVAKRWQENLKSHPSAPPVREYLKQRGLSPETISEFRLGYVPDQWDDLVKWAQQQDYELSVMETAGLVIRKEGTHHYYDRFRGRLMIPICDDQSRVIAFSGRSLNPNEESGKYINSPETPLFSKRRVFFGLDKAKRSILKAQHAVICEGQLDTMACHQAEFRNVVAPQGTALTADHCRTLKRYVEEVILCFDSDSAGQNAVVKVMDDLLASGLSIRVAVMPPPHDPDSLLREKGAEAFREILDSASGFFDFYLKYLCRQHDTTRDVGKSAVVREMGGALHKANDLLLLDDFARKVALSLGVSPGAVRNEFKKSPSRRQRERPSIDHSGEPDLEKPNEFSPPSEKENWLLRLVLLQDVAGLDWLASHMNLDWVLHGTVKFVLRMRIQAFFDHKSQPVNIDDFSDLGETERSYLSRLLVENLELPETERQIRDCVQFLRKKHIERQISDLKRQVSEPELPPQQVVELSRRIQELIHLKRRPLGEELAG